MLALNCSFFSVSHQSKDPNRLIESTTCISRCDFNRLPIGPVLFGGGTRTPFGRDALLVGTAAGKFSSEAVFIKVFRFIAADCEVGASKTWSNSSIAVINAVTESLSSSR